jgi:hypothetical protein
VGVPVKMHSYFELTEPAYDLWVEGRLLEELGIPDDRRTRVEIIGGEIVVSPVPYFRHAAIATQIQEAFVCPRLDRPDFPWRAVQTINFNLKDIRDGYIPDLVVLSQTDFDAADTANALNLTAEQIGMAIEITSKSTAAEDREPGPKRTRRTKWTGYANEGVGFYLLVDRAPDEPLVTLFSNPNRPRGIFRTEKRWRFGETVVLPEPFGVEIPTEGWQPWDE